MVPGPPIPRLLVNFLFSFLFFSIPPTDPISGNAFDAKRKKRGDGLSALRTLFNLAYSGPFRINMKGFSMTYSEVNETKT